MSDLRPDSSEARPSVAADGYRRRHLWDDASASEAVVRAVATAEDADVGDLPPLGECVDTDSLDGLFDAYGESNPAGLVFARTEDLSNDLEVRFEYAGYEVTVTDHYVILE